MPVDEELTALRREVREFLDETLGRDRQAPCDCWQREFSREFSEALGERGWLGMTLPPEYGGAGRSALERFVVAEELLAAGAPVAAHWITERQVAPAILRLGTEEQRRKFLPGIVRGEIVFAIGMSEPDSGSDLASVKARARRSDRGWSLSGQKTWSSLAHEADDVLVLCRTSDGEGRHDGLSQLIVDCSLPGVEIRRIPSMGGDDHFCEVFFDDVPVPADGLLGVEGEGWSQVNAELAFERGGPERYLSAWPLFAAFVRCGAGDELATQAAGELAAQLIAVRQLAGDIAGAMDSGEDFRVAAALEKDAGTTYERGLVETISRIAADTALVDGGFASVLAEATAAAPSFTLRGGTTEILRTIVARELAQVSPS
jgi:acyl-CoA dehydrogenase